jgi:CPA2 family monovalent cation:H+ antiporter-2
MPVDLGRDAEMESCLVPAGSPAAGRTIEELKLRPETGATLLALKRDGKTMVNPSAGEVLRAGDVAVLFGYRSQVDRAMAVIDPGTDRGG